MSATALMDPQTKRCSKCGEVKPLDEFHRHKGLKDGRRTQCKSCRNDASRRQFQKLYTDPQRRAEHIARASTWNKANPDRVKAWKDANCDKVRASQKRYYESHREERAESHRAWRAKNPEWTWLNRKVHKANTRAREYGVPGTLTMDDVRAVFAPNVCGYCGQPDPDELDHVVALGLGGDNTVSNLQGIHFDCHKKKTVADKAMIRAAKEE